MRTITLTGGPRDGQTREIEEGLGVSYVTPGPGLTVYRQVGDTDEYEYVADVNGKSVE